MQLQISEPATGIRRQRGGYLRGHRLLDSYRNGVVPLRFGRWMTLRNRGVGVKNDGLMEGGSVPDSYAQRNFSP